MVNPFENEAGQYVVLVNQEGQYSLWPEWCDVPKGWTETGPKGARKMCLDWIDVNWKDMRPNSLKEAMSGKPVSLSVAAVNSEVDGKNG